MLTGFLLLTMTLQGDTVTERTQGLDEVVIVSAPGRKRSVKGEAASIDEHLLELQHVDMVRRGSYAWEPMVNNMQTERLSVTIDGMKIFSACTDRMDPVTSYVESGNLQSISMNSGLDGNPQATGNIGGSLDLRLRKTGFDGDTFHLNATAGHEWNGHLQVYGADAALSSRSFYTNFGAFYRQAADYYAGGHEEIPFSQFQKVNAFANLGVRFRDVNIVEGTFIFDRAFDVGYPALNMDVAKAEGFITSLSYRHLFSRASWETKVYYNHITHEMDDTHRPNVEIHMDMPGRSWTTGIYNLFCLTKGRHDLRLNHDLYYNRLFADMTMYPGGAAPMYMVTWPDVGTLNTGLAANDQISLGKEPNRHRIRLSAKVAWQQQRLNSDEGYRALRVFFPTLQTDYQQLTGRLAVNYQFSTTKCLFSAGAGWGSRAPSVTEAYGYYLNNTFDRYDYIGNPHLKNESAVELNAAAEWKPIFGLSLGVDGNLFLFSNYIIGEVEKRLSPMTIGAEGVKVYNNISHATIANTSLTASYQKSGFDVLGTLSYAIGRDADGDPMPLIAPLGYTVRLGYHFKRLGLGLRADLKGNAYQNDYAPKYGETPAQAYAIVGLAADYHGTIHRYRYAIRCGVENLFDKNYSTYADWNKIPQKGRNVYMNLTFEL
ncbi:MAG: hypothetical protein IKP30_08380 [Bacteroidaceae bacterium]|nr:hypothetical protein [Bacteroidaceae bacterium]